MKYVFIIYASHTVGKVPNLTMEVSFASSAFAVRCVLYNNNFSETELLLSCFESYRCSVANVNARNARKILPAGSQKIYSSDPASP